MIRGKHQIALGMNWVHSQLVAYGNFARNGNFTFNGQELAYTTRGDLNYDNENLYIEMVYNRGGTPYREGQYKVELYAEGFKIGEGGFEIK